MPYPTYLKPFGSPGRPQLLPLPAVMATRMTGSLMGLPTNTAPAPMPMVMADFVQRMMAQQRQQQTPQQAAPQMAQTATVEPPYAPPQGPSYTVRSGDTLSGIAKSLYGDAGRWRELASGNQLPNPNLIRPGQVLNLPGESLMSPGAPVEDTLTPEERSMPPAWGQPRQIQSSPNYTSAGMTPGFTVQQMNEALGRMTANLPLPSDARTSAILDWVRSKLGSRTVPGLTDRLR
jgi:LysM repeat protein